MSNTTAGKTSRFVEGWWPTVTDAASARKVGRYGAWICWWLAVLNLVVFAIPKWNRTPEWQDSVGYFLLPVVFAFLGFGIWRMSRGAAVAAMALWIIAQLAELVYGYQKPSLTWVILASTYFCALACGTRGTLAYSKLGGERTAWPRWLRHALVAGAATVLVGLVALYEWLG